MVLQSSASDVEATPVVVAMESPPLRELPTTVVAHTEPAGGHTNGVVAEPPTNQADAQHAEPVTAHTADPVAPMAADSVIASEVVSDRAPDAEPVIGSLGDHVAAPAGEPIVAADAASPPGPDSVLDADFSPVAAADAEPVTPIDIDPDLVRTPAASVDGVHPTDTEKPVAKPRAPRRKPTANGKPHLNGTAPNGSKALTNGRTNGKVLTVPRPAPTPSRPRFTFTVSYETEQLIQAADIRDALRQAQSLGAAEILSIEQH